MYNRSGLALDDNNNPYFIHNDKKQGLIYMFYNVDASGWYINSELLPNVDIGDVLLLQGWRALSTVGWPDSITVTWQVYSNNEWSTDNTEFLSAFCVDVNSEAYDDDTFVIHYTFLEQVILN